MYAQALEANGFNGETKLDLGSEQIADKALQNGQIDLYPEYTGTAARGDRSSYEGNPPTWTLPKRPTRRQRRATPIATRPTRCSTPAPFNNTYGIFVRR